MKYNKSREMARRVKQQAKIANRIIKLMGWTGSMTISNRYLTGIIQQ